MNTPGTLMNFLKNSKTFDKVLEKVKTALVYNQVEVGLIIQNQVKILSVGNGKCSAELKVDESHTNPMGGLHGGFSATLVDSLSTYTLLTKVPVPSVSVEIHLSYLKGAKLNDEILIDVNVVKTGKSLAFLEVEIKNKATGDLLVKGSQTQFLLQ